MRTFKNVWRVKYKVKGHSLEGQIGTVVRRRLGDNGAWVEMDNPLPDKLRAFPVGDSREKHVILYPEECEAV